MKTLSYLLLPILLLFNACIGDDIVEDYVQPAIRVMNPIDTLGTGETWQFEVKFTNNIGAEENLPVQWSSSDPAILGVDANGLVTGLAKGTANITAEVDYQGAPVTATFSLVVDEETVVSPTTRSGTIATTSGYALEGEFVITEEGNGLKISIAEGYNASTSLPGLYIYLGNNKNSVSSALEIGKVTVFDGAHEYLVEDVGLNDFGYILYWCKPFNVKVGEGKIE